MNEERFWPIEVKWANQMRVSELKQVLKYKNAQIWSKVKSQGKINDTPIFMLPFALLGL